MKKLILSAIIGFVTFCSFGQVTLEHTYNFTKAFPTTHFYEIDAGNNKNLYILGENETISIYNNDHTIRNTINLTNFNTPIFQSPTFQAKNVNYNIATASDELHFFFRQSNPDSVDQYRYVLIDESATILLTTDTIFPTKKLEIKFIPNNKIKIYTLETLQTQISFGPDDNIAKIYSLVSSRITSKLTSTTQEKPSINLKAYPNPSSTSETTISYELPASSTFGEMKIYNLKGIEVDTFKIGKHFNSIKVNTSIYTNGTYVCKVYANGTLISSEKLVVQK